MRRRLMVVGIVALLLVTAMVSALEIYVQKNRAGDSLQNAQAALVNQAALRALPHKSASSADTSHVASNVVPPTNTWFSGMVLQSVPKPVYPMPLSFLATDRGFSLGLPDISSTATQISGSHVPGVQFDTSADTFKLTRYDKISATLTYLKGGQPVGNTTITEGSPFVFYKARSKQVVTISGISRADVEEHDGHYVRYHRGGTSYVLTSKQASMSLTGSTLSLIAPKDSLITAYALPHANDTLRSYADNPIQSVTVDYDVGVNSVTTNFRIKTSNNKPAVLALLPYAHGDDGEEGGSYPSIWGTMKTYHGRTFRTSVPRLAPANELPLAKLSATQKQAILTALPADIAATKIDAQDSYYAGKQLARAANLLSIAEQLGQTDSAKQLTAKLSEAFRVRLHSNYFYYDTTLKGIAAAKPAFGSEDFNDHHFHYGYWLYAGSILAKYDSSFLKQDADQLNLLAADIASPQPTSQFPAYRNYDAYAGHSWAAGLAPFNDGNNQESSSEAIHAWNGVASWGKVTKNTNLERTGEWMLANESHTAQQAWRSVDTSSPTLRNYTSPVASLNFGGKRTYGTFFSAAPSAILGIQLIPMDPNMRSFRTDGSTIDASIKKTIQADNYNVALGDYILMYLSLRDPQKANGLLSKQTVIDDGNSMSYLKAFIYVQQ